MARRIQTSRKELRSANKKRRKVRKGKLRSTKVSYKKRRPAKSRKNRR